jgi:hypothetical protein
MKGAAEFCLAWLTKDKNGKLIISPSTSSEAQYRQSDGFVRATLYGGTADIAIRVNAGLPSTAQPLEGLESPSVWFRRVFCRTLSFSCFVCYRKVSNPIAVEKIKLSGR